MLGSLVPWRTRYPVTFRRIDRDMEELMDRFFRDEEFWGLPERVFAPSVDVAETDKGYEVTMDLPGIDPNHLTVEIREGSLWVSGERKEEKEEKGKTFHRVERHYGAFRRLVPFDLPVDREKVEAKYHDGVLKITVAKMPEAETKRIEVKAT
ncbi:MAG: Hsp20/alpha crystallin family protein [Planctomycetes bacterium]|nr:Hsp20/alpha crystallin family protein [Planctomycetota bacterium]